jgi:hypothetical protein
LTEETVSQDDRMTEDRRWEMGDGRWEMGDGRWEMGDGREGIFLLSISFSNF